MTTKNSIKEKTLWFNIISDYRSGPRIHIYNKPPSDEPKINEDIEEDYDYDDFTPEEACEISFELPKKGFRLYIVNEYPTYKPIWYKDLKDNEDFKKIYLKLFSQIHDCMPFKVSGYNSAYKEKGEYPDVPKEIKSLKEIGKEITNNIIEDMEGYYFMCVIDYEGNQIYTALLNPIC